jgi:hypothetical protein
MDMRLGTWNVRSLYRAGSVKTAASELARYNSGLVAVKEVRWVADGSTQAGNSIFLHGNATANHQLGKGFFVH